MSAAFMHFVRHIATVYFCDPRIENVSRTVSQSFRVAFSYIFSEFASEPLKVSICVFPRKATVQRCNLNLFTCYNARVLITLLALVLQPKDLNLNLYTAAYEPSCKHKHVTRTFYLRINSRYFVSCLCVFSCRRVSAVIDFLTSSETNHAQGT